MKQLRAKCRKCKRVVKIRATRATVICCDQAVELTPKRFGTRVETR